MKTISIYDVFTDNMIAVIKTNYSCDEISDNYNVAANVVEVLYEYGIFCGTDIYGEYTPNIDTNIVIK